ncbi:glycosyltransferase [Sphingobacterium oryzagri]|uniref:Glycosyltransferase n=1 Tax=Sphingobacterium oryzagri TaxID=3025669 RepID=A0ABY7WFU4_9SPHI|nr:glycosyltransferase [Sphingobacterium sp. KACC 22765]WDF68345.1 glycosyltransferase [Sphingobacterium sp. KACC 22765]
MKILQLGKFYPIRGGVEKVMYDLMLGLSAAQISCDMLCASTEDHPGETLQINDFARVFIMPTIIGLAATKIAPAMISTLKRIAPDYDVVHVHHPDPMAALALLLSGYKGKVVLHWHSDILKQKMLLKVYSPLQNWLIKRADRIVGTTPVYVKESNFLQNVQAKVTYLPIGVEPLVADMHKVQAIKETFASKKIIFSLGRLVEYKGYAYLIEAMQYLPADYQLLIGGKGPLQQELENLIDELGLREKVTMLGFVADQDVAAYYAAASLFCLPSIMKTEAFAIVQIEAMSFGKPIVCTKIPGSGVAWVNEDGVSGLHAAVADAQDLADKIKAIGEDQEKYTQLSQGAQQRYENFFTRERMTASCLRIYEDLWKV